MEEDRKAAKDDLDESATQGMIFADRAFAAEALVAEWERFNHQFPPANPAWQQQQQQTAGPPWAIPGVEPHDLPAGAQCFVISDGQSAQQTGASISDAAVTARSGQHEAPHRQGRWVRSYLVSQS